MKRVFGNRLRQEARKFNDLQQCIAYLEDSGRVGQLFDIVYDICNSEKQSQQTQSYHNNSNPLQHNQGSKPELLSQSQQQNIEAEEILKENLKIIMSLVVDEVWKNYDNYNLQKKVLDQQESQKVKENNQIISSNKNTSEFKVSVHSTLNRDFIEPKQGKLRASQSQKEGKVRQVQNLVVDDFSSSDISDQSILNPTIDANVDALSENKENYYDLQVSDIKYFQNKQVFAYNTAVQEQNMNNIKSVKNNYLEYQTSNKRRQTEQHHQLHRFQSDSELIFSQFQTPQYKQSEIGNPISSPHTDERDFVNNKQNLAKNKLLAINLLSQENSAKGTKQNSKKSERLEGHYYTTISNPAGTKKKNIDNTMNLEEIEYNDNDDYQIIPSNPSNLIQDNNSNKGRQNLEEIMLKNIWEIENNPIFSNTASINEPKKNSFVIQQFNNSVSKPQETSKFKEGNTVQQKVNYQQLNLESESSEDIKINQDGISQRYQGINDKQSLDYDTTPAGGMNQAIDEDSDYNDNIYFHMGNENFSDVMPAEKSINDSKYPQDVLSETKVAVTSIDGQMLNHQIYKTTEGQQLSKLIVTQMHSQPNLLFQYQNNEDEEESPSKPLLIDQQYMKSVPKTGRDHYYQKKPQIAPKNKMSNNVYNTTQDSNSLMISSEQPTKLSAEEVIRNYTNANFIPQKQANDRLHLLCQSRELNPLVSLSVENDDELENRKIMPQTARVHSAHNHLDSQKKKQGPLIKEQQQQMSNKAPKHINQSQISQLAKRKSAECDSRSKTPTINRPITGYCNSNTTSQATKQQCYTQGLQSKKDDSAIESKYANTNNNNHLSSKLVHSAENTSRTRTNHQILQKEGRYIVNKLAKVIKAKASSSQSRNQMIKQCNTGPLNINPNFLLTQNDLSTYGNTTTTAGILGDLSKNIDQSMINRIIMNNTTTNAQQIASQIKTSMGFVSTGNTIQNKGNQTTKYQQLAFQQQLRTDSQQSARSNISQPQNQAQIMNNAANKQINSASGAKNNRFGMRRFTADPNDEHNRPQIQNNAINATSGHLMMNNHTNVLSSGQSSSRNNQAQMLGGTHQLPPHQRSMIHLHQANGTISPQQIIQHSQKPESTGGISGSNNPSFGGGQTSTVMGNGQKILSSASSHKNIIQNSQSAQQIIYGKLLKNQRKKIDLC